MGGVRPPSASSGIASEKVDHHVRKLQPRLEQNLAWNDVKYR